MSLYTDKHRLFAAYVNELNKFRPDNPETETEAREQCDIYISSPDCTWKNIFAPDTNELVGFLILGKSGKEKHPDTDRAIAEAYVAPEYRRQGLMTAAVKDYESRHKCTYSLLVLRENMDALSYWEKLFDEMHYRPYELDASCVDADGDDLILLGFRPGCGFDAPAIGQAFPKEWLLVRRSDGTVTCVPPEEAKRMEEAGEGTIMP